MAKKRFLLIPFVLAFVVAISLFIAACGAATYGITWEVSEHATVTVIDVEGLPSEIEQEATLSFKVEPKTGYEISSVKVNDRPVNADKNGVYTTIVKADVKVSVETTEKIASVTVKTNPTTMTYYAGQELDAKGMEVEVKYATDRTETVTGYSVVYPNTDGNAFALGDTSFAVKYKGVTSASVNLAAPVKALVTLNLNKGSLTAEQIESLSALPDYNYDEEKGVVSWTYAEALAEDFTLPEPTLPVEGVNFPFLRWGGVEDNKIKKGSTSSITAVASYETRIVVLDTIGFETEKVTETVGEGEEAKEVEVTVVYLVIKGEFKAGNSAYLYLYEGNEPPVELVGPTINKAEDTAAFTLKFDMRDLVATGFKGKWMDIKFCAKIGEHSFTQEIDLNNYSADFIVGKEEINIIDEANDTLTRYTFKRHTPNAGEAIKGTDGETYVGNEKLLKVVYETVSPIPAFILDTITLEERDAKPYLIIEGIGLKFADKADAEAKLANFITDMQTLGNWAAQSYTQTTVVNDDLTFEIAVCLENVTSVGNHVMHANAMKDVLGNGDNNFNPGNYDKAATITVGDYKYTLGAFATGWGWDWFGVNVVDTAAIDVTATNISLVSESGAAYLVISGTHEATAEKAMYYFNKILNGKSGNDLQNMKVWSYGCFNATGENANTVVTATENTWTLKIDLAKLNLTNALHNIHLVGADCVKTDALTVTDATVTVGDITYKLDVQNHWEKDRPILEVSGVPETPAPETPAE